jgi:hypothetical protein
MVYLSILGLFFQKFRPFTSASRTNTKFGSSSACRLKTKFGSGCSCGSCFEPGFRYQTWKNPERFSRLPIAKLLCFIHRPSPVVLMDSRIAQGIWCEICDWTLLPGTCLEEHNSGLVHRTLLDAVARLAPDKFLEFRDAMISTSGKKSKFALKRELRKAASQVSFFFFFLSILPTHSFFFFLRLLPILVFLSFTLSLSTDLEGFGENTVSLQPTSVHF